MRNDMYALSSIFGLALATFNKKADGSWGMHITLYPRGVDPTSDKRAVLTQSGFKRKKDAIAAWVDMGSYIEVKLSEGVKK